MNTNDIIASMLTENTGRALCDSGDIYGRHWQRNQGRIFASEEAATLDFRYGIDVTLNVYHWLSDRLEYDPDMDAKFQSFLSDNDMGWLEAMEAFPRHLAADGSEIGGIYGEDDPVTVNTYNGEDLLSQIIQYVYFTVNDDIFVALQIHNGADVRGGYTAPRIFSVDHRCDTGIFDNARATIYCSQCPASWNTDDGHNWYRDGACGLGAGTQLDKYDRTEAKNGEEREEGKLHVTEEGDGLCPCCGGLLKVSP